MAYNWIHGQLLKGKIVYKNRYIYEGEIIYNKYKHGTGDLKNDDNKTIFTGIYSFLPYTNYTPPGEWKNDLPMKGKLYSH